MFSAATRHGTTTIVIVDPCLADYQPLIDAGEAGQANFCLVETGEDALRTRVSCEPGLWLINSQLPDMTGLELHQLLRPHLGKAPVFLVADRYDPAVEIAALQAGSLHFVCKPLTSEWMSHLCRSLGGPARRSVPHGAERRHPLTPPIDWGTTSGYERAQR